MKYIRKFNESDSDDNRRSIIHSDKDLRDLYYELERSDDWVEGNLDEYPNALFLYTYKIREGFEILILSRSYEGANNHINNVSHVYLVFEEDGEMTNLYLDNLFTPYNSNLFYNSDYNKYIKFAKRIADKQMEYYDKKLEFPSEYDIKDIFVDVTDSYDFIDIKYGFLSGFYNDGDEVDVYSSYHKYYDLGYVINFDIRNIDYEIVKSNIINILDDINGRLKFYGNYSIKTHIIDNILSIIIT